MTTAAGPRRRRRWPLFALAAVALLAALLALWPRGPAGMGPLSAEERELVGTWAITDDLNPAPPGFTWGIEFRTDRDWWAGMLNPDTGTVTPYHGDPGDAGSTWRLDGTALVTINHRRKRRLSGKVFGKLLLGPDRVTEYTTMLAWDGPTRLRWRRVDSDGTDTWTSSGTWTRVQHAP